MPQPNLNTRYRVDSRQLHAAVTPSEHEQLVRLAVRISAAQHEGENTNTLVEDYETLRRTALDAAAIRHRQHPDGPSRGPRT